MANIVLLPQIGISEESAVLTKWHAKIGDAVKAGDVLFSLETGKSSFDVEAEHSGVVLALLADEGDEVAVKAPVCVIGAAGEEIPAGLLDGPRAPAAASAASVAPLAAPAATQARDAGAQSGASGISPRAKMLARKCDADPALANPSGPGGRIIERDVRALVESGQATRPADPPSKAQAQAIGAGSFEDRPLSAIRKTIAKNMAESLANTAQLTHSSSFDATCILEYRERLKQSEGLEGITIGDMVLFAVSRALSRFPELNAWLSGDTMRVFGSVNLACAVDTEKGLMVPVIFGASEKTLLEISTEIKALAQGCRAGNISPALLSGGSFTVSNLGQYGIESFTPIINPPQTGILGVNTITARVKETSEGLRSYPCMSLSLTYDHRALDGAPASRFLQSLCKSLENFTALLAR